jgi:hypothetical protein
VPAGGAGAAGPYVGLMSDATPDMTADVGHLPAGMSGCHPATCRRAEWRRREDGMGGAIDGWQKPRIVPADGRRAAQGGKVMPTSPLYINAVFDAATGTTVFYGDCRRDGMLFVPSDMDSPMLIVTLFTTGLVDGGPAAATLVGTSAPGGILVPVPFQGQQQTCIMIPYDYTEMQFTITINFDGVDQPIDPTVINVDPPGGGTPGDLRRGPAPSEERTYHLA